MSLRLVLVVVLIVVIGTSIPLILNTMNSSYSIDSRGSSKVLKVFCAGSLYIPLKEFSRLFSTRYGVDVHIEPSGSVMAIRKVIDLGKVCDVLIVADYRLIPMYLYPKFTKWYVAFARNEVVIAFTNSSKFSSIISKDPTKIFEVLKKHSVRIGFSDPNQDPCGYRAIGVIALASLYYRDEAIIKELLLKLIPNLKVSLINDTIHIYVPSTITPKDGLVVRPKSVDLIHLLETGEIDYAFEYKSVAIQHGLKYVELPSHINLANPNLDPFYSRVVVHILVGTEGEKAIPMGSIVYGVTIPKNAPNYDLAIKFVKLLLSNEGRHIFETYGQEFLKKPLAYGLVPNELSGLVKIIED